jgi:hypothetical protein
VLQKVFRRRKPTVRPGPFQSIENQKHDPLLVTIDEHRIDALLMALDDDNGAIDAHEPRSISVETCRIEVLLQQLETAFPTPPTPRAPVARAGLFKRAVLFDLPYRGAA